MVDNKQITISIHKTVFLLDKLADRALRRGLDLSLAEFRMLMVMRHSGGISQKAIAKFWEMTEAAVSRQVSELARKNYFSRRENTENRRALVLTLTSKGERVIGKAFQILNKEFEKIYKVISPRERDSLAHSLDKLFKVLCQNVGMQNGKHS